MPFFPGVLPFFVPHQSAQQPTRVLLVRMLLRSATNKPSRKPWVVALQLLRNHLVEVQAEPPLIPCESYAPHDRAPLPCGARDLPQLLSRRAQPGRSQSPFPCPPHTKPAHDLRPSTDTPAPY